MKMMALVMIKMNWIMSLVFLLIHLNTDDQPIKILVWTQL